MDRWSRQVAPNAIEKSLVPATGNRPFRMVGRRHAHGSLGTGADESRQAGDDQDPGNDGAGDDTPARWF